MKKTFTFATVALLIIGVGCKKSEPSEPETPSYTARDSLVIETMNFPISNSTIRAIQTMNDSSVWFAGGNGQSGYTLDNGISWELFTLEHNGKKAELRGLAINGSDVFAMGVQDPTVVFHTANMGASWDVVFEETNPEAFFVGMDFYNSNDGILFGDPIDNIWYVATTSDGGMSWDTLPKIQLPESDSGEYAFAASNSNFKIIGDHFWFASGGMKARVYHSSDKGASWESFDTPIQEGGAMTGIYTMDFYDAQTGIIAGGNWNDIMDNSQNMAVTSDGGKTWALVADGENPNYTSCVQYIPNTNGKELITLNSRAATGIGRMMYSNDGGYHWQELNGKKFLSIHFSSRNYAWMSGVNKISRLDIKNE